MAAMFPTAVSKRDCSVDQMKTQFILNSTVYFAFQPVSEMHPLFSATM